MFMFSAVLFCATCVSSSPVLPCVLLAVVSLYLRSGCCRWLTKSLVFGHAVYICEHWFVNLWATFSSDQVKVKILYWSLKKIPLLVSPAQCDFCICVLPPIKTKHYMHGNVNTWRPDMSVKLGVCDLFVMFLTSPYISWHWFVFLVVEDQTNLSDQVYSI